MKEIWKGILTLVITLVIFFLIAEVLTRVFVVPPPAYKIEIRRNSSNLILERELILNTEGIWGGSFVKINSEGMRDDEYGLEKPKDVYRIAVLGDSNTFGLGVEQDETYSAVLERMLEKNLDSKYEVLNFGVPGYTSKQELELLKTKVLSYEPDLVILAYTLDDPEEKTLNVKIEEKKSFLMKFWEVSSRSRFVKFMKAKMKSTLDRWNVKNKGYVDFYQDLYENDSEEWEVNREVLKEFYETCEENNIKVLIVVFPLFTNLNENYPYKNIHEKVILEASEDGYYTLDLFPYFKGMDANSLRVSPMYDTHPNKQAHNIIANAIYLKFEEVNERVE